jgi:DNA-binding response OmpR family regulator
MPEQSGFDIFRSLKEIMVATPPVIMLSAVTGMKQRVDARDLGVHKYITKPTTPTKLIETIRTVLAETTKPSIDQGLKNLPPKSFSG